jgi:hypothetical protein
VNPNATISELIKQFGPAETPDAEVGIHSIMKATEWFRVRPDLRVLQILSERIPCAKMCAPMHRRVHQLHQIPRGSRTRAELPGGPSLAQTVRLPPFEFVDKHMATTDKLFSKKSRGPQ